MKMRCYNQNNKSYKDYGARGITVCDDWLHSLKAFYDWSMSNGYKKGLTLDRIDNNKGYYPENCRWVTRKTQNINKRNNVNFTYEGKTQCLKMWAKELNIPYAKLYARIYKLNWPTRKAFETPGNSNIHLITYKNKTQSLKEWSKELGLNFKTLSSRINTYNWPIEQAFETPTK